MALRSTLSDDVQGEVDSDVPPEVATVDASDGDDAVAHNIERPAGNKGTKKRKPRPKGKPLSDFEVGQEIEGKVKNVQSFGAFVGFGCEADGLLHISRISDDYVADVNDVIDVGQEVKCRIHAIDTEKKQVRMLCVGNVVMECGYFSQLFLTAISPISNSLTLKHLGQVALTMKSGNDSDNASSPSDSGGRRKARPQRSGGDRGQQKLSCVALAEGGYDEEKFVDGMVVSTMDFGAFVRFDTSQFGGELTGELDGLVHISAMTAGRLNAVTDKVNVGDKVKIRVKDVDSDNVKISLSMITKEEEPQRGGGGSKNQEQRFDPKSMGASDWKESMGNFDQADFRNDFVLVEKK
mgnify:CR=1 FL=1